MGRRENGRMGRKGEWEEETERRREEGEGERDKEEMKRKVGRDGGKVGRREKREK